MTTDFGQRLAQSFDAHGQLCVGIDPHRFLLDAWNLPDSAAGLREFGLRVVDAAAGQVGVVKPQVGFFERHGSAGYQALEEVIAAARAEGILVIADAKRGDLGTSVEAYAEAWLTVGSPLEADAMTMSAFQGVASLDAPIALAHAGGKGVFVLAATSNPESFALQRSVLQSGPSSGSTVSASIVDEVAAVNARHEGAAMGSIGVVIGATVDLADYGMDIENLTTLPAMPILAPGFGHQGAKFTDLYALFGAARAQVLVSASRSVLAAGPTEIAYAIRAHVEKIAPWRA